MGYEELVRSLRNEGEEKIRTLRNHCATESERIKAEKEETIHLLREQFRKKESVETQELQNALYRDAEKKASAIRISAQCALSDRLFNCAQSLLPELRTGNYHAVFRSLAEELPDAEWDTVTVHPDDLDMAQALFPQARITGDHSISGGLAAAGPAGTPLIVNTFEKRLERIWDDLLPLLLSELQREGLYDAGSSGNR